MRKIPLLVVTLLLFFSLSSLFSTAMPVCSTDTCEIGDCDPGFACRPVQCACPVSNPICAQTMVVCRPCQTEDCSNSPPPSDSHEYASASTSVTTPEVATVDQIDVYVDVDDQDDGVGGDIKNPSSSVTLNGCKGFVEVWCEMSAAQQPSASVGATSCTFYSQSGKWYGFKCGSFDGTASGTSYTAKCKLGSSSKIGSFTLVAPADECQGSCAGSDEEWLSATPESKFEAGSGQCCGDDGSEYTRYYKVNDGTGTTSYSSWKSCCDTASDCANWDSAGCFAYGTSPIIDNYGGDSGTSYADLICGDNNVIYECNANTLCDSQGGKGCYLDGSNYLWSSSPPAEGGNVECRDTVDNDCNGEVDYDTLYETAHGDAGCPVGVSAASVSPTSVKQNGVVDVSCTSTVGETNALFVYRDNNNNNVYDSGDVDCGWKSGSGWSGSVATFKDCPVGSTTGSVSFRCSVYDGGVKPFDRAYMVGTEQEVTVTVTASSCAAYSDQASCEADASCDWLDQCSGVKERTPYGCVEAPASFSESCSVMCGAQCDGTTVIPNGYCDLTTCTPACNPGYTWNGTACEATAYSCTGPVPDPNAQLCLGDDQGLTADTPKVLTFACSAPAGSAPKCEYVCGAGYVYNSTGGAHCSVGVGSAVCGNSAVEPGEQCDDGNMVDGDGCSATCQYENCLDAFTGPSGGSCSNIGTDGYLLSWTPPAAHPWANTTQVLRVDEDELEVNQGCPTPGDCEVKNDSISSGTGSYLVAGVLQPETLYYNRVVALCQNLDGSWVWKDDIVWNCTTAAVAGLVNLSGYVWDESAAPIYGVSVTVVSPPPGFMEVTGADGMYRFVNIPAGLRRVSVSKPGYRSQTVEKLLSAGENSLNFTLTDGDCESCADWEGRCSVACSGVDQCGVPVVPAVCEGARPGDVLWDADKNLYVTCCEGLESRPKLDRPTLGGCMDEVRKSTILRRYLGQLVSVDVYTWKPCATS